jgi:hypothetical protein
MDKAKSILSILGASLLLEGALALTACFGSSDQSTDTDSGVQTQPDAALSEAGEDGEVDATTGAPDAGATPDSGYLSDATDGPAIACTPTGTPIMHTADIAADETWASGVHVVPGTIQIKNGAKLTIAGCSQVQLGSGASLEVTTASAGLDAVGTASDPITFVAQQAGMRWGAVDVVAPAVAHLAYATLSGGGTGPYTTADHGGATITGHSSDTTRPVVLRLEHTVISGSGGLGLFLTYARLDPASIDLTITGSGWYPVYAGAASAGDLPVGSYKGNGIDAILLQTMNVAAYDDTAALASDVTLKNLGVPYRVGIAPSSIVVGDGINGHPAASLTLQAGVKLLFTPQGAGGTSRILVNAENNGGTYSVQGALVIQGTSAAPVVLDSAAASPASADWEGLYFANLVDPRTSIAHATIAHAGGTSGTIGICPSTPAGNNGAATCAVIVSTQSPPTAFLKSSEIDDAPCGVYRGWAMGDVDFAASNTFSAIPGCTQTSIPDAGSCAMCPTSP